VTPEPFTREENAARASADLAKLETLSPAPTGPISLEEAEARALAYNLDNRLQMFNSALQDRQLDLTRIDMLPSLTANAGYTQRDRELVSSSASFRDGRIDPSNLENVSVDRERTFADLTLSWNIVDFGMSYLQAKQQSDRVQIAKEQRRRVVNNLFQQVRSAYWAAVAAEQVRPRLVAVMSQARNALASSRALEAERAQQPAEALRYQRALMELIQDLEAVDDQLAIAKTQLAQLMGLRPGTPYTLMAPAEVPSLPPIRLAVDEMERMALLNRPEVREEAYNTRIAQQEGRRALLRLVPGVSLLASLNYDSNSFLRYNSWQEAGARVTANIFRIFSAPRVMELNEVQAEIAESRRLAMTMAVIAQVHIAGQQYQIAQKKYERARAMADISRRIAHLSADASDAQTTSKLDLIFENANAALAELRRNRAYADLQNADAYVRVTLGQDPLPEGLETRDLQALIAAIRAHAQAWRGDGDPAADAPRPSAGALSPAGDDALIPTALRLPPRRPGPSYSRQPS
jgi:outer membrane protein TolC